MSVFMIDTDSVSSVASSLTSLSSQLSSLSGSVSGYDTTCDEFDFSSAKGVISGNIEACSAKVSNTVSVLEKVVSSHTELQNKLKFGQAASNTDDDSKKTGENESTSSGSTSSYGNYSSSSSYSSGSSGGYSYASAGGSYASLSSLPAAAITASAIQVSTEPVVINKNVSGISHAVADKNSLSDIGKALFDSNALVYNNAGYATIGGMFVISCGSEYGKVGDIVEFTLKDGQTFKCIVGENTSDNSGNIKFFVNDKWTESNPENFQAELGSYITKIRNYGTDRTYAYGASIGGALDWAEKTANDNTHGYSQSTRWGNPNYDCSSFVISSYEAAGVPVKEAGASYTGNMRKAFINSGFEWIPGTPDVNNLKPGDVLLAENYHTEMYFGNGMMIGAHGNSDGADGDSGGNEISITKYSNKNWDGVLRYVGNSTTEAKVVAAPNAPRVVVESSSTEGLVNL